MSLSVWEASHPGCLLLLRKSWRNGVRLIVMLMCVHVYMLLPSYLTHPDSAGWLLGGGLLELPVHVVMWTSVQWTRRVSPSPGRLFILRRAARISPSLR